MGAFTFMKNEVWNMCFVNSQVKELNHVLEAEKSCRTDLEMYVAVLNTQKSVLQEDAEKLRKELHEGMQPKKCFNANLHLHRSICFCNSTFSSYFVHFM